MNNIDDTNYYLQSYNNCKLYVGGTKVGNVYRCNSGMYIIVISDIYSEIITMPLCFEYDTYIVQNGNSTLLYVDEFDALISSKKLKYICNYDQLMSDSAKELRRKISLYYQRVKLLQEVWEIDKVIDKLDVHNMLKEEENNEIK